MSHTLDRLAFFTRKTELYSNGHGVMNDEDRSWEEAYRRRWQHDKIVRSTHGVNCTGSCSWKIYVKGGIVTWETQQTDYPRTRPDLPNHEPRGCARGASYSWYLYSGNRVKYPLVRGRLIKLWREARKTMTPVQAWTSIVDDPQKRKSYTAMRGGGGLVRSSWEEVTELIGAANAYTVKRYGPDRVFGFSPIPAMSMISYAAGARYLQLLGGACGSFYDWYCDLPPASPQTWGEQTDVPESADWYNSGFIIVWGSNVPQTRTPDAHFYTEVRYKGTKSVVICPDYSEASKFADLWVSVKQGTDAALAMAMGHVVLTEFHRDREVPYFRDYVRRYTDMPLLVRLVKQGERYVPERLLRASDFADSLGQTNNPEWKTVSIDQASGRPVVPTGSIGFRWGEQGKWNLEEKDAGGVDVKLRVGLKDEHDEVVEVLFPYFANTAANGFASTDHPETLMRRIPAKRLSLKDGDTLVASVYDLFLANYGVDQGFGGEHMPVGYDDLEPYTPAWAEKVSTVPREQIIAVARGFASNAEKTNGRSMVIIGAAMNHWYHMDMNYRGVINLLAMCGCIGQSGGGWSHYVGQEKLRPQTGWAPLAFALDWARPPRQQNSTSFFYAHSDQWRYETLDVKEILSPTAPEGDWGKTFID
ncbi:MAG TPA: nitrate reductase subunit alpha, partial [Sinorhizobium sp.]|nr:nitrate reductase subunit alpha [Sinorhizobium sp.]